MKKLLCVVPALLLFAMISAPNARADSYSVNLSCFDPTNILSCGVYPNLPTVSDVTFPDPTLEMTIYNGALGDQVGALNFTLPSIDQATDSFEWFLEPFYPTGENGSFNITVTGSIVDETTGTSTEESGVVLGFHGGPSGGPLTFTAVTAATPEPASILLMLLGIGLVVLLTRERFVMRIPRTA